MSHPVRGLRVSVDARPLDIEHLRTQGIGRYAHGLLGPLGRVASERGGRLVLLRQGARRPSPYSGEVAGIAERRLRRPPLPERLSEYPEQVLLPLDLRRARSWLHHSLSIYRAAVWPGVPSVMTMHDVVPLMWPEHYLRTGLMHRMLYRAARGARLLLAVSEAAQRDAIAHLAVDPERVLVVPEAADERFAPSDPRLAGERLGVKQPYLLWVGGLAAHDPRKNLTGLLDAYAGWRRERSRPETLVLAGRVGDEGRELAAHAARGGAPVLFAGFVPDEELPSLYSGASCFLTASRYEGFGLPALEAISCGTPVVAFDAGAIPAVAGAGGRFAPDGDHDALMRAVEQVCDDRELRARLSQAGMRHARRFSWARTAELTWKAYERAAGTRDPPRRP